jgi:hypothetical protein
MRHEILQYRFPGFRRHDPHPLAFHHPVQYFIPGSAVETLLCNDHGGMTARTVAKRLQLARALGQATEAGCLPVRVGAEENQADRHEQT